MGTARAPVAESGAWPAWRANVLRFWDGLLMNGHKMLISCGCASGQVNNFVAQRVRSLQHCNVMKTSIHRREFLKLTSAASLAAPLLLSSSWAKSAQRGPNDRITLGFIGTGTQGRGLLNNFLGQPDTQVVAGCRFCTTPRE